MVHHSQVFIYCCYNSTFTASLAGIFEGVGNKLIMRPAELDAESLELQAFRAHVAKRADVCKYMVELVDSVDTAIGICEDFGKFMPSNIATTSYIPQGCMQTRLEVRRTSRTTSNFNHPINISDPTLRLMSGRCDKILVDSIDIWGSNYETAAEQLAVDFFLCRTLSTKDVNFTFMLIPEKKYATFTTTTRNMEDVDFGVRMLNVLVVYFIYFFFNFFSQIFSLDHTSLPTSFSRNIQSRCANSAELLKSKNLSKMCFIFQILANQ